MSFFKFATKFKKLKGGWFDVYTDYTSRAIPLFSSDERYRCSTFRSYGIVSSSSNKDLAWAFMKFLLEEKQKENNTWDYTWWLMGCQNPINKANLINIYSEKFDEDIMKYIYEWMLLCDKYTFFAAEIDERLDTCLMNFHDNKKISPEEAAREMQEIADMYLNEL